MDVAIECARRGRCSYAVLYPTALLSLSEFPRLVRQTEFWSDRMVQPYRPRHGHVTPKTLIAYLVFWYGPCRVWGTNAAHRGRNVPYQVARSEKETRQDLNAQR